MAFLRFVSFVAWTAVFVLVLLFAIKNAEPVTLRFYFDTAWQTPLVLLVLVSFASGAVFGVIACVPALARQRREILGLRKELRLRQPATSAAPAGPERAAVPDVPLLP
jgi:uncharacterized integral membrane protein